MGTMEQIDRAEALLKEQLAALARVRAALQAVGLAGRAAAAPGAGSGAKRRPARPGSRRKLTPAGKAAISRAAKARWRAYRRAKAAKAQPRKRASAR